MALNRDQVETYDRDGFLIVENVLSDREVAELQRVTDSFVETSRGISEHDDIYDLEPDHSSDNPRVRRIKTPHIRHPVYEGVMRHPAILSILQQVVNPSLRLQGSKLNMKPPGNGAAVEWHQDWAFHPHTNDDLCAVGVMMDDCELENGPLLCIPGSHKGPIHDHHSDGHFAGAIDPEASGIDFDQAVACTGKAGSISVHHVRTMHGSAVNTSPKPRRLLLFMYRAADAWPLVGPERNWDDWTGALLCGDDDPLAPRLSDVPVRLPYPKARSEGSIYEIQRNAGKTYFAAQAGQVAAST